MHIGVFTDLFHPRSIGGGENRLLFLMLEMVRKGHDVTVITTSVPGHPKDEYLSNGIRVYRIGSPHPVNGTNVLVSLMYVFAGILHLRRIVNMRFDVIESNTYMPCYLAAIVSKVTGIPHIMTIHDTYLFQWASRLSAILVPFAIMMERSLKFLQPDIVVTVSRNSRKKIMENLGFEEKKVVIINNGVSVEILEISEMSAKEKQIIFAGRLIPHKHVDHLILAFKDVVTRNETWRLIIIGDGPERVSLEQFAYKIGLSDKITFTGFLEAHQEVSNQIKISSIMVSTSTVEGFGMVLLEAMALGALVVAYDIPAYHDFVVEGLNAKLVKPYDVEGIAYAINSLIANDQLREQMIQNGLETAKKFSWSTIAQKVIRVYQEALRQTTMK